MPYSSKVSSKTFHFKSLRELLAKANEKKSGDALAGLGAESELERVAAKWALSEVSLEQVYNEPVIPPEADEVSRVLMEAIDYGSYNRIRNWSVAELREFILSTATGPEEIKLISDGLTPEMAAAVAKIMSNLDLLIGAKKCEVITKARTTLGLPGRLSSRLQPNHPSDNPQGIAASIYEGLAYGVGDAVIGINPVSDTAENTIRLLNLIEEIIQRYSIPTQSCVLAHVTTQMRALKQGAPMGLMFQSLAGTEAGNKAFGITVSMLDEAAEMARKASNVGSEHVMYFETGQGSELSSQAHEGVDQLTLEARCYGLARRYKPFIVNSVVGFIGPEYLYDSREVSRAGLEDHFTGKLLGVPMGVDVCYTNHMYADQNDIESLAVLLSCAGANYFMGVPMGDDVMLNYQCTSFHDISALRELLGLRPAPEFEAWLEKMGIMEGGHLSARAGDFSLFINA